LNIKAFLFLITANLAAFAKQLVYAFHITPNQLAIWALCFFMLSLFTAYGSLGFSYFATRNMALEIAEGGSHKSNRWAKGVLVAQSVMIIPFIFGAYLFLKGGVYDFLEIFFLILFFVLSNCFFQISMYEKQLTSPYNYGKVLLRKSLITFILGYLVIQHYGITGVIYLEGIACLAFGFWYLRLWLFEIKFDSELLSGSATSESLKYFCTNFLSSIHLQIDRFYSIRLLSQLEFGILNFGLLINTISLQLQYVGTVILIPKVSKMIVEKRVAELHLKILTLMVVAIFLGLCLAFLVQPVFSYLIENYYPDYISILTIYWGIVLLSIMRATEFCSLIFIHNKQTNLLVLLMGSLAISAIAIYLTILVFKQDVTIQDFGDAYIIQAGIQAIIVFAFTIFSYYNTKSRI
jgi:O-antigen/teichoic acid export membrane protein